jgi:hypothetical protein
LNFKGEKLGSCFDTKEVKTGHKTEAFEMLFYVSEVSRDCYEKAMALAPAVFEASAAQHCDEVLQAAITVWATAPTAEVRSEPSFRCCKSRQRPGAVW